MEGFASALGQQPEQEPVQQAPESQPQGQPVTPEQQRAFNQFVGNGMMMLWDEGFMADAQKIIQKHPDETDAMAMIGAAIAIRIVMERQKQGEAIDPAVLLHGGWKLMQSVAEFAEAAGVEGIEPDEIENAFYLASDKVWQQMAQAGLVDEEATIAEMEELRGQVGEDEFSQIEQRVQGVKSRTMERMSGGMAQ